MNKLPTWTILGGGYQSYLSGHYDNAYQEWLPLAELGDAEAQYNLGVMHDEGAGREQNPAEAAAWYHKAAKQGFVDAQTTDMVSPVTMKKPASGSALQPNKGTKKPRQRWRSWATTPDPACNKLLTRKHKQSCSMPTFSHIRNIRNILQMAKFNTHLKNQCLIIKI